MGAAALTVVTGIGCGWLSSTVVHVNIHWLAKILQQNFALIASELLHFDNRVPCPVREVEKIPIHGDSKWMDNTWMIKNSSSRSAIVRHGSDVVQMGIRPVNLTHWIIQGQGIRPVNACLCNGFAGGSIHSCSLYSVFTPVCPEQVTTNTTSL